MKQEESSNLNSNSYETIKIGNQIWMSKNLNVNNYRNGDQIPEISDEESWKNLKTGGRCHYENKKENGIYYGKLYNWYAISDTRGLAPEGFHIPSFNEWNTLISFFKDKIEASEKLKSKIGWGLLKGWEEIAKHQEENNSNEFNALPGGARYFHDSEMYGWSSFGFLGTDCNFWSSTKECFHINIGNDTNGGVGIGSDYEDSGFSVRCIKD